MIDPIAMEAKIDALEAENKRLMDKLLGVRQIARYEVSPTNNHLGVRQRIDEMITEYLDGKESEADDGND